MASSLTIAPSLGHSLVTAQGMAGGYDAIDDRAFWGIGLQEGAVGSGDFMVTERGAGANMTVDVACNTGHVVVQGDTVTNQGLYVVRPHTAVANLDIATAHATLPRVDSVVVQVDDDEHDNGGNTRARVMVLTGTATSGATLDNRTGAASLPASAMLLADVLVPATDTSISNSQIRDRRKWARGAYVRIQRTGGSYAVTATSLAEVDTTNLKPRIECSGAPLKIRLATMANHGTATTQNDFTVFVDGARPSDAHVFRTDIAVANEDQFVVLEWTIVPSAGSHTIALAARTTAGTLNIRAENVVPLGLQWEIEELVRQNTANNSTTSG